jgi:predicted hotdog family 3-hydroxylacyl-ACP dehydratase
MHLDRAWIAAHIPHHGAMCLLDEVLEWDDEHIRCRSASHRAADNPLLSHGRLGSACGVEYAAQAMAVHGALLVRAARESALAAGSMAPGGPAKPASGFIASLRGVRFHVLRLDDVAGDLLCEAVRMAGDGSGALYEFEVRSTSARLLSGRATVVLDANDRMKL